MNNIDELKEIWKSNTLWQNVFWIGNVLLLLVVLPYYIVKEYINSGVEE